MFKKIFWTQQNFGGNKKLGEGTAPECPPWLWACCWISCVGKITHISIFYKKNTRFV